MSQPSVLWRDRSKAHCMWFLRVPSGTDPLLPMVVTRRQHILHQAVIPAGSARLRTPAAGRILQTGHLHLGLCFMLYSWVIQINTVMKVPLFKKDRTSREGLRVETMEGQIKQLVWEMLNVKFLC